MMIWGNDTEFKDLENQNKICSAFKDEEKVEQVNISLKIMKEVAEVTQLELSDVQDLLSKFKQLKEFHKFLKERRQNNQPMPESREDLMLIYRIERPDFIMGKKKHYSQNDKIMSMFRAHT